MHARKARTSSRSIRRIAKKSRTYSTRSRRDTVLTAIKAIGTGTRHDVYQHIVRNNLEKTSLASVTRHLKTLGRRGFLKVRNLGNRKYRYSYRGKPSSAATAVAANALVPTEAPKDTLESFWRSLKLEVHRLGSQIVAFEARLDSLFKELGVENPSDFIERVSSLVSEMKAFKALSGQPLSMKAVGYLFSCIQEQKIDLNKLIEAQNG